MLIAIRLIQYAILTLIALSISHPALAARWTLRDLLSVNGINQAVMSPDGQSVAFVRGGQIVSISTSGGDQHVLTHAPGGREGLSWSPNGQMIAYAKSGNICVFFITKDTETCLTRSETPDPRLWGDHSPQWAPNGRFILFERGGIEKPGQLMMVAPTGGNAEYLIKSDANDIRPSWSPNGTMISFTEVTDDNFSGRLKLVKVDPETGRALDDARVLHTVPTDRGGWWQLRRASWAPDSKTLAVILPTSGWDHVSLISVDGGTPRQVTSGAFEESDPVFSPDGKSIALISNQAEPERRDISIVPLDGGQSEILGADGPGTDADLQWTPDGRRILYLRQTATNSSNIFIAAVDKSSKPLQLTDSLPKALDGAFIEPEKVTYRSSDGTKVSAFIYEPKIAIPSAHRPAIMWIHGGPEEQTTYELSAWQLWAQYLAQAGYVVMMPNYRGSTGYGEKFRNLNVEDSGGHELDDVITGAEYLIATGKADKSQIAIAGQSHGGTMVGYAVTEHPGFFKAAIVIAGVWNRETYLQGTYHHSVIRWRIKMGGTPSNKPAVYRRANSLSRASKIDAPILIFHGEIDPVVPPEESAKIVSALTAFNKTFYYYTYAGEYHGLAKRPNKEDMFEKQLAFLKMYINPNYAFDDLRPDLLTPSVRANIGGDTKVAN